MKLLKKNSGNLTIQIPLVQRTVPLFRKIFGKQDEKTIDEVRLEESLNKTRSGFFGRIGAIFQENEITDELWDKLEESLIMADVGMETTQDLVAKTRDHVERENIKTTRDAYNILKREMVRLLQADEPLHIEEDRILTVVLVVGVNGSGKTTTIGKLAYRYKNRGKKVVLAAGDTFRAAAIEQLQIWGQRAGVDVIAQAPGSDPAAVLFDAMRASQESRRAEILIADTAGRLQNKFNLMQELEKMRRVAARQVHRAPHEILLVLDASTGQNAILQVKGFKETAGVTGIVLTKLDGTSKGGAVLSIKKQLGVPVRFVGTGEKIEDLAEFDPVAFVEGLLGD
jgi:fused signal recognition particle receptor